MLLRFQLRHSEQEAEHVELVPPRQLGQVGGGLCNKDCSLFRATLTVYFIGSRTPRLAPNCARPPAPCFGQKFIPMPRIIEEYPF
jgi:hypothetical protein